MIKETKENITNNGITVKVLSIKQGLLEYENVKFVRVISKDYTIMIMKDYLPVIGEIEGKVEFQCVDGIKKFDEIKAYYMHKHNEFNLFIK